VINVKYPEGKSNGIMNISRTGEYMLQVPGALNLTSHELP